jgi:hypothetical protein
MKEQDCATLLLLIGWTHRRRHLLNVLKHLHLLDVISHHLVVVVQILPEYVLD